MSGQMFLETLTRSNLLSADQIVYATDILSRQDAAAAARDLVARGWLTDWQARQLLSGRSKLFLGRYVLLDVLGQGGMGAVLKAHSLTLNRIVALKVMSTELSGDEIARARFEREIQFAAVLNHPHIVRVIDADSVGNRFFMVMEYCEGRDLKSIQQEYQYLPIDFACECIRQAALGLQHAHERDVVHRDIKPSNLLVTTNPATGLPLVKILDLGLARLRQTQDPEKDITRTGQIMGSPDYMAPEQAMNSRNADIRSDIYGLGATLFHLLAARLPYDGANVMEKLLSRINTDAPPVSLFRSDVPPVLVHVIARMLHRDPAQRFQTPAEVAAVLEMFVAPQPAWNVQYEQPQPPPVQDIATLDARVDETMNFIVDHLDSRVASEPVRPVRRRRRSGGRTMLLSLGGTVLLMGGILYGLSLGTAVTKKVPQRPVAENGSRKPGAGSAAVSDPDVAPPPDTPLAQPAAGLTTLAAGVATRDTAAARWARTAAAKVSVATADDVLALHPGDRLPGQPFSIVELDLSGLRQMAPADVNTLTSATRLQHLNLSGADLGDETLPAISSLKWLTWLDLSGTRITDDGLRAVADLAQLETLSLRYTTVSDAGLESIARLSRLKTLDLRGTNVSDQLTDAIAGLTRLTRLDLRHTRVTEEQVRKLRSDRPDCEISF